MRLIAVAMMLMATPCLASEAAYELSLELTIDGEHIAYPNVVVENGVKSTINLDGKFIDVMASARPHGILISFWIGELDGSVRKLVATPSLMTRAGLRSELRVIQDDQGPGMKEIELVVTAQEHSQ